MINGSIPYGAIYTTALGKRNLRQISVKMLFFDYLEKENFKSRKGNKSHFCIKWQRTSMSIGYEEEEIQETHLQSLSLAWEDDDPETQFMLQELKERYELALAHMPSNQRSVFLMNRLDGLTYKENRRKAWTEPKSNRKKNETGTSCPPNTTSA